MSLGRWSFRLRSPRAGLIIGAGKRFRSFSQRSNGGLPQSVAGRLTPDDLTILGPVHATKLKASTSGLLPKYAVDLWMVPDGSRILDLSTRCKPQRLFDIATEARKFPCAPGLSLERDVPDQGRLTTAILRSERHQVSGARRKERLGAGGPCARPIMVGRRYCSSLAEPMVGVERSGWSDGPGDHRRGPWPGAVAA